MELDIGLKAVLLRWRSYSDLAEVLVVSDSTEISAEQRLGDISAA